MLPHPELDFRRTPVTLLIAAVAVAIELVCTFDPARRDVYYSVWKLGILSTVWSGELWRPFTTTLLHDEVFRTSLIHAAFNVYWLVTFGRALEPYFRPFRYFLVLVVLAFCATMPSFLASNWDTPLDKQHGTVGLSGVIYGLFGILWMGGRYRQDFRSVCNAETVQFFIAWFLFAIVLALFGEPVDNVAHGAGGLVGILFGKALFGPDRKWMWRSTSALITLVLLSLGFAAPGHPLYEKHCELQAYRRAIRESQVRIQIRPKEPDPADQPPAQTGEDPSHDGDTAPSP